MSIVLVASLWSLLKPPRTNQTSLSATPPATAPSTTLPQATTTTKPKPRGVTLVLHYIGASWTRVATDGKVSFRGTGAASDRRTFRAREKIDLTLGAPAQVQVEVNGQSIVPDCKGCVWQHSFTLDSLKQGATNSAEGASGSSSQSGGTSGTSSNRSSGATTSTRSSIG